MFIHFESKLEKDYFSAKRVGVKKKQKNSWISNIDAILSSQ